MQPGVELYPIMGYNMKRRFGGSRQWVVQPVVGTVPNHVLQHEAEVRIKIENMDAIWHILGIFTVCKIRQKYVIFSCRHIPFNVASIKIIRIEFVSQVHSRSLFKRNVIVACCQLGLLIMIVAK